ncbi:MAG: hypothetical protein EXQ91_00415 [Alphaproteobacteria bacterium]|nr:hypothetical protein [Alphaproteobacteria bacterium]
MDEEAIDRLVAAQGFAAAFAGGREANEGFHTFQNYIGADVPEYRAIALGLRMLLRQIELVLHNYPNKTGRNIQFLQKSRVVFDECRGHRFGIRRTDDAF